MKFTKAFEKVAISSEAWIRASKGRAGRIGRMPASRGEWSKNMYKRFADREADLRDKARTHFREKNLKNPSANELKKYMGRNADKFGYRVQGMEGRYSGGRTFFRNYKDIKSESRQAYKKVLEAKYKAERAFKQALGK